MSWDDSGTTGTDVTTSWNREISTVPGYTPSVAVRTNHNGFEGSLEWFIFEKILQRRKSKTENELLAQNHL